MNVDDEADLSAASLAAAIGEPARARMLYSLIDGRARTSTELAVLAEVTPSTASVHLQRLKAARLVKVYAQGKHRYYSLDRADVATALEALSVAAGSSPNRLSPRTPHRLRDARTCYDHIAGALGVALHDRCLALRWLSRSSPANTSYGLTPEGARGFEAVGIDVAAAEARRRRLAFACLDWSERRPHLAGALAAALLDVALRRGWVRRDPDGRALTITPNGRRAMRTHFGLMVPDSPPESAIPRTG